ncbi:hypothetical protein [Nibricoccus sp. IMCC34717]|uniref:hypothetical protein n=1 Tax=Nibricoccus sp. IMCC34717 TaxID=3034021 RepID=UPI00385120EF
MNALFAGLTGRDLYLAEQIRSAIALSLAELEQQTADDPQSAERYNSEFNAAAARLLQSFYADRSDHGFAHWDATRSLTEADPLFARAGIMEALKSLAPFPEGTLLITNLRPALLPAGQRRTARREQHYQDMLAFIRELSASRISRHFTLHLLFL